MNIVGFTERDIIRITELTLESLSKLGDTEQEYCGYLTLRDDVTGRVMFVAQIGTCPDDKAEKYFALSLEKGQRLFQKREHVSSFQSRDPDALINHNGETFEWGSWGGAVRLGPSEGYLILSFSGLPELLDETLMLALSVRMGLLKGSKAKVIANLSQNPHFLPLMETFGKSLPSNWRE